MGQFFMLLPNAASAEWGRRVFHSGIELEAALRGRRPSALFETPAALVASFSRVNGSGAPAIRDPQSGSWLAVMGTWFHSSGLGPGDESRLLRAMDTDGIERVTKELEGFFTLAYGDGRTNEVHVVTDIVGSRHCFARTWAQGVAICGSSMLLAGLDEATLDPLACQEFLATGVLYKDRTFYREVRKLGPGTRYVYGNGARTGAQRYWSVSGLEPDSLQGEAATSALRAALANVTRKIAAKFPRRTCDLTGGFDSRALIAALRDSKVDVSTVVSGGATSPDVVISKALAGLLGLPHRAVEPQPVSTFAEIERALDVTDGEYDCVEYARVYTIQNLHAQSGDITLNGSFGEVARGFWWEVLFPHAGERRPIDADKLSRVRYATDRFDASLFARAGRLDLVSHMRGVVERTNAGLETLPNTTQMDNVYLNMRMQRWQGRIASSTDGIWPCLSPFMMREVLEVMLRTRSAQRRRSLLIRQFLLQVNPMLANYPLEHGYPPLPMTLSTAHRFWPLIPLYGRKVMKRLERYAGVRPSAPQPAPTAKTATIWDDAAVAATLHKSTLRCAAVLDEPAVKQFIARADAGSRPYPIQLNRLLSLECALDRLAQARNRARET